MTHNTITHRHRFYKVYTHIPLPLVATIQCHRYVLYITDPDAVDQCRQRKVDSHSHHGQRHLRVFAHERHNYKSLDGHSTDTLEQRVLLLLTGIVEKEMEKDKRG